MNSSSRIASRLRDAGALWLAGHGRQRAVVECACELLSEGHEGDGIARLAGHPFEDEADTHEVETDVRAALRDLRMHLPARESEELLLLSLKAMCRRHLRGRMTERELAEWAHRVLGHTGPEASQPLVEADDAYDLIEDGFSPVFTHVEADEFAVADVDELVRRTATALAKE